MAHIQSSCHHPLVYQCAGCESQYADLSGLLQHVESSACQKVLAKARAVSSSFSTTYGRPWPERRITNCFHVVEERRIGECSVGL